MANAGEKSPASNSQSSNRSDPKPKTGTCILYEDTPGRRNFHDNSHATGATDIENNQYQGPAEVKDKIILHHTPRPDVKSDFDDRNKYQTIGDNSARQEHCISKSGRLSYYSDNADRVQHFDYDYSQNASFEKRVSQQQSPEKYFEKHSSDRELLSSRKHYQQFYAKEEEQTLPTRVVDKQTVFFGQTPLHATSASAIPRPMSPLTIDISSAPQNIVPVSTDERNVQSTFYYSQMHGPLKSPGIFVPYADDRKREIIENAIREALEREERTNRDLPTFSLQDQSAERFNQDLLQPFPLQDPPKSRLKRQMSNDSNDSNDNRTQSHPSKRLPCADKPYQERTNQLAFTRADHMISTQTKRTFFDVPDTAQIMTIKSSYARDPNSVASDNILKEEKFKFAESVSKLQGNFHDIDKIERTNVPETPSIVANVPETPYTKNVKWVVSSSSPNSVNDFIHATPESACLEESPDFIDKNSKLSCDKNNEHRLDERKRVSYSELDKTICSGFINKDLNAESFPRDVKPPSTDSSISGLSHLKVTEKGFRFPSMSSVIDPILLSPRVVSDRFQPKLESTPKTLGSPIRTHCCTSTSQRNIPSPATAGCSWQQSPRPKGAFLEDVRYSSQHIGYNPEYEAADSLRFHRPTLSTELQSTMSRSTSVSNPNNSMSRQRTDGYLNSSLPRPPLYFKPENPNGQKVELPSDCIEERYINHEVERFFRSYSAVELSPSKKDIEIVRDRVRKIYRSMSSPAELREFWKNMLIEERIKEDLTADNDVFDCSPLKYGDKPYYVPRCSGNPTYLHDSYINECQFKRDESMRHDAKRRLFADPTGHQQCSKGKRPVRESTYGETKDTDLPGILEDLFRPHVEELQHEEFSRMQNRDDNNLRFLAHERPQLPPDRQMLQRAQSSSVEERSAGGYECNLPGCSHSNVRYARDSNRKRKRGDIELCVNCEEDEVSEKSRCLQSALRKVQHIGGKNCSCAKIESAILEMARDAYQKIRRMDSSEHSFDRFNNEATETREQIFDSVKVLCSIKSMCKYGRIIEDIFSGSIIFLMNCPTLMSLEHLWSIYLSGELKRMLNEAFITDKLKVKYNCPAADLHVTISSVDYQRVKDELLVAEAKPSKLNTTLSKSDTEIASVCSSSKENYIKDASPRKKVKPSALAIIHMRSQSAPSVNQSPSPSPSWMSPLSNSPFSKERKFSFSNVGDPSSRKVFQEINTSSPTLNTGSTTLTAGSPSKVIASPTLKKVFDFDVSITSKSSPKRKTFGELMPWENENIPHETSSPKRKSIRD